MENQTNTSKVKVIASYVVGVECAIEHNGKFLIIRRPEGVHAGGLLAFPGGGVEYYDGHSELDSISHDILLSAVRREVFEEVGLDLIDPLRFVRTSYFVDKYGHHVINVIYHCEIEKTPLALKISAREVPEYFWLTPEEIYQHERTPIWLTNYMMTIKRQTTTIG